MASIPITVLLYNGPLLCGGHKRLKYFFIHLEDAGSVRRPPGVQQIIFASADKPLAAVGELE